MRSAKAMAFCLALCMFLPGVSAAAQRPPSETQAPEFRLTGDSVIIPFTMVREFPFVQGQVAGVPGKFLLDTGARDALALNHHRIPMEGGISVGTGKFGSGQTYDVLLHARSGAVEAGPVKFSSVTNVTSQDASQLERITPDFLGWIGYYAWSGYALKMDYKAGIATFYKGGPTQFLRGETVLAAIPYEARKLDNNPIFLTKVGGVSFETVLDTGQYGRVFTDATTQSELERGGWLRRSAADPDGFDVKGIQFPGGVDVSLTNMEVDHDGFPAAQPLGMESANILSLGYAFLQQYKTVWDFPHRTIYLLRR